jgi:hypothetical protein
MATIPILPLCFRQFMSEAWPHFYLCIRPENHAGECKGIGPGMTEEQARKIASGEEV